jgi:type I restriction enzyme, S subunit
MTLNDKKWETLRFGDFVRNIVERVQPQDTGLSTYVGLEHLDSRKITIERHGSPEDVIGQKLKFYKNDVIFGKRRAYLRKAAIAQDDGICSAHSMVLRANEEKIIPNFLPYFLHSDAFMNRAVEISEGSLSPTIKWNTLARQEFLLPQKNVQEQILSVLMNFDCPIQTLDRQESDLRIVLRQLTGSLISEMPKFGTLFEGVQFKSIRFSDAVSCIEKHEREAVKNGLSKFVGLEDIESTSFKISSWGDIENGTTFTKTFGKGDVLFGKRRAYLRKVAVADFNGLCSSDILVFRPSSPQLLRPELLPFYVVSDAFMEYAINTSAGSLSPRTKWRDLAKFQLRVPNPDIQLKVAEVLQAINSSISDAHELKLSLEQSKFATLNRLLGTK